MTRVAVPQKIASFFLLIGLASACSIDQDIERTASNCASVTTEVEWRGLTFDQPSCWTKTERENELILVNEKETNTIVFSVLPPDQLNLRAHVQTVKNAQGENVYITISDEYSDIEEVDTVINSLKPYP